MKKKTLSELLNMSFEERRRWWDSFNFAKKSTVVAPIEKQCMVRDCEDYATTKGLCKHHYYRYMKYGNPTHNFSYPVYDPICSIEGCENPSGTRGLCKKHYTRFHRHGDPRVSLKPRRGEEDGEGDS